MSSKEARWILKRSVRMLVPFFLFETAFVDCKGAPEVVMDLASDAAISNKASIAVKKGCE